MALMKQLNFENFPGKHAPDLLDPHYWKTVTFFFLGPHLKGVVGYITLLKRLV